MPSRLGKVEDPVRAVRRRSRLRPQDHESQTIDEVIERLTRIVEESHETPSRAGYFAALYRQVTIEVRDGIAEGFFDDGPRMERLDVIFANRYLAEYDRFQSSRQTETMSWQIAFDATDRWWPITLQHLLLGMNAHINLDLAIATAETAPSSEMHALRGDFEKINTILSSLIDRSQDALSSIWCPLWVLDRLGGRTDEMIMNLSLEKARDAAWDCAMRLSALQGESPRRRDLSDRRRRRGPGADWSARPGPLVRGATRLIRLGEPWSIRKIIRIPPLRLVGAIWRNSRSPKSSQRTESTFTVDGGITAYVTPE